MEKEFVPYEQSLQLKELGLDEPCFGYYQGGTNNLIIEQIIKSQGDGNWCLSPTFSQAFEFLLEKYNLYAVIIPTVTMHWTFKTMTIANGMIDIPPYKPYKNVDGNDYNSSKEI